MIRKLMGFIIRFRVAVLILMVVVTGYFAMQIFKMEMYTQFLDLFPANHAYVQIHKLYQKYFGGAYQATLVLEVKEGDVFNTETLNKIFRIQYDVDMIKGVDHFGIFSIASPKVTFNKEEAYGFSTKQLMKRVPTTREGIEDLRKKVLTSHVNGSLVSLDQKAVLLNATFIEGRIDFNILFDGFMKIKEREEDANHKIYLTGTPVLYGWVYHHVPDMIIIFIFTTLFILILSLICIRGWLSIFPFVGAIVCSIWGLGLSSLFGFHFDPLIVVIPFLLSARAISHGVQWVERFEDEYIKSGDTKEAAWVTGTGMFRPGLISIFTDALGLLLISFTPIPILQNLAYLGTFWALTSVFGVLFLFPAIFSTFKGIKVHGSGNRIDMLLERILGATCRFSLGKGQFIVVGIAGVLLVIAVLSSTRLKYGDANPGDPIMWPDSEYNVNTAKVNTRFPGVDQMWVVIEAKQGQDLLSPDVMRGMEALKYHMISDPNVGFVTSIADILKSINSLAHGNDPKTGLIPSDAPGIKGLFNLYSLGTSPGELDPWIVPNFDATNVRLYLRNHEGSLLKEVITRISDFIEGNPDLMENAVAKPAGGLGGILAAANEVIAVKNHQILFMVLGLIFIVCALTYRSFLAGVIFTMSLVLANFLAFTWMVFRDVGLNINTMPVVALGIGLGVDYGLYIVSRIMEEYQERQNLPEAVITGVKTAGRAVFYTAVMMTGGVIFWYFSPLRFQAEMGFLLGILMMVNMLVGLLVLPGVISILKPKFIWRTPTA